MNQYSLIVLAIVIVVIVLLIRALFRLETVFEFERGLRYFGGKFVRVLGPGQYLFLKTLTTIRKIDMRKTFLSVSGQEVLSSDGVAIRTTIVLQYAVVDPVLAVNAVNNFVEAIYTEAQLALRELIGSVPVEELLVNRSAISAKLLEATANKTEAVGVKLFAADVKDFIFPGKLKETFAQVVTARQQGLAALEKARGETAALRNLANAAKMLETNPSLLQLRALQALGESTGNTLVFGMPGQAGIQPTVINR